MQELEQQIQRHDATLCGTLCWPKGEGPFPIVVMIHGSGPCDRNEIIPGQRIDLFNTLAKSLASMQFASLRYDKRGCAASTGDYYRAGHSDHVADAIAVVEHVASMPGFRTTQVYVLGHSEGCVICPQVFIRRPQVSGLILLCPFIDKMESILMKQIRRIQDENDQVPGFYGFVRAKAMRVIGNSVKSQEKLLLRLRNSNKDTIRVGLQKIPAKWLRELLALDPRSLFSNVTCDVLAIGGEKDLQCDPVDVLTIAEVIDGNAETHVVPNLTHVLRLDQQDPRFSSYSKLIEKPVEPLVLSLISRWLQRGALHNV